MRPAVPLIKRGMSPLEIIRAATINAAELMDWQDKVGTVEAGHYADPIAANGNPLVDISVLHKVMFVMKGGTVIQDGIAH